MTKKLILKKTVSSLMQCLGVRSKGARVLNYHSTPDEFDPADTYQMSTPRDMFLQQMQFLHENRYNVISCAELVENIRNGICIGTKTVAITFDDGYKNNVTNALPVLEKYNFKATIFLATDLIGQNREQLNWDDVSYLSKTGIFSFGAHSITHRNLSGMNKDELEKEIKVSKNILEQILKNSVEMFAYPFGCFGSFDNNAIAILKTSGYKAAFTSIIGYNTINTDPYLMRRMRISWFDDNNEFPKQMAGAYDWYALWQRLTGTP